MILQLDAAGVADARVREERNVGEQRPERATFTDKNMQRKINFFAVSCLALTLTLAMASAEAEVSMPLVRTMPIARFTSEEVKRSPRPRSGMNFVAPIIKVSFVFMKQHEPHSMP